MAITLEAHLNATEAEVLDSYTCPVSDMQGPAFSMVWVADDAAFDDFNVGTESEPAKPDFVSGVVWHQHVVGTTVVIGTPRTGWEADNEAANGVRALRIQKLAASDFTQIPDSPLTVEQRGAWATYRQALRDLPETYASPDLVVWPTEPT